MDHAAAAAFACSWADQWNRRDLEGLLSHFTDEVVFTSPIAAQVLSESGGVLRGKEAVRRYWGEGMRRIPDLHFDIEGVYAGVNTVVIHYRNHTGALVCEVLTFEGPLVVEGHGTYLTDNAAGASGVVATFGDDG